MQIGYNNDVEYRGKTFHIQTEDRGEAAASIETQIFHAGAILDTSIISYQKVLDDTDDIDERIARVRAMMQANHKSLYKKLLAGEYDAMAGLEPLDDRSEVEVVAEDLVPSQDRVPAAALQVEQGNLEAFPEQGDDHMDIGKLKDALAAAGAEPEIEAVGYPTSPNLEPSAATMQLDAASRSEAGAGGSSARSSSSVPAAAIARPARVNGFSGVPDFAPTGATAYRGCEETSEELSIVELVEAFVSSQ